MNILRYRAFSQIILYFLFTIFSFFLISENQALYVKNKCVRGQGKVRQVSRISALGFKEKCVRGQREVHRGSWRSASAECVVFSFLKMLYILKYSYALVVKVTFQLGKPFNQACYAAARRPLTDATPTTGKIHPFSKTILTFEPVMQF